MKRLALFLFLFSFAAAAGAANTFGYVEFVSGGATVTDPGGHSRPARVDEAILEGETLTTTKDGELHARTEDHGLVALRGSSTLKIEVFIARGDKDDTSTLRLVAGALRAISGWIGRYQPERSVIKTRSATIGIRGTDHETMVVAPGDPIGPAGTYDKVNEGATFISNDAGRVEVAPEKAGFAPHDGKTRPSVLEKVPDFIRPGANEARIKARKEQLAKEIEERRLERQRSHEEHRRTHHRKPGA
ncbi:MAG: hypothetical protein ACM3X5_01380 [Bacillota bacterium]